MCRSASAVSKQVLEAENVKNNALRKLAEEHFQCAIDKLTAVNGGWPSTETDDPEDGPQPTAQDPGAV